MANTTPSTSESALRSVSIEQFNPTTGDLRGNTQRIAERMQAARAQGSKLVVFPELAITGYCLSDLVEDQAFLETNKEMMTSLADASKGIIAIVGFVDFDPSEVQEDGSVLKHNSAAVFCDGKLVGIQHKRLLPNFKKFDDKRYFTPGDSSAPIEVTLDGETLRVGVLICEDMWDKNYDAKPFRDLCAQHADLIVAINSSPGYHDKFLVRDEIVQGHLRANPIPFVYANTVGAADIGKTIVCFDGESLAYNRFGSLVAKGDRGREQSLKVDLYSELAVPNPRPSREAFLFETLVMGLRDYAVKCGFTRAIVPVSGGIDSALGLAIAVAAFGSENVGAYTIPSRFNSETTKKIAADLAANFGVAFYSMPIDDIDECTRKVFETHVHPIKRGITRENIHPRLRGLLMMIESNDSGPLLISCGNKTEIALGYATLYGDMCGGVSVIGDLSKKNVYRVARYVNELHGRPVIPERTFTIKPSAELAEGQYDPFDYSIVSDIVDEFTERRRSPRDLLARFRAGTLDFGLDDEGKSVYDKHTAESFEALLKELYRQFRISVPKRLQGAPVISATERSFGFDLREPIINKWEGY